MSTDKRTRDESVTTDEVPNEEVSPVPDDKRTRGPAPVFSLFASNGAELHTLLTRVCKIGNNTGQLPLVISTAGLTMCHQGLGRIMAKLRKVRVTMANPVEEVYVPVQIKLLKPILEAAPKQQQKMSMTIEMQDRDQTFFTVIYHTNNLAKFNVQIEADARPEYQPVVYNGAYAVSTHVGTVKKMTNYCSKIAAELREEDPIVMFSLEKHGPQTLLHMQLKESAALPACHQYMALGTLAPSGDDAILDDGMTEQLQMTGEEARTRKKFQTLMAPQPYMVHFIHCVLQHISEPSVKLLFPGDDAELKHIIIENKISDSAEIKVVIPEFLEPDE